ncbi:MAG: HlyC/CorC family transporter [Erysipelotrichaceae bacterium]|nr:HlyC/CorC family transporter [Erysipelotrichaceae bacterium]
MNNNIIFVLLLLILGSAFFSAAETAFNSLNRIKLKNLANSGDVKAERTLELVDNYGALISSILIGNNIVNIAATSIFTLICIKLFGDNGATYSTLISTIVILVLGEVIPKTVAKSMPEKFAMSFSSLLRIIVFLLKPFTLLFSLIEKLIKKIFKIDEDDSFSSEELLTLVEEATNEGNLDEKEADLVTNAIEFNDLEVRDILTPRVDVIAVSTDESFENILKIFNDNNYSRVPVYEGSIDNIVGILHDKDFYYAFYVQKDKPDIKDIMKDVVFTSAHVKINTLLRDLQSRKLHMAVVIDEYGGTEGIITMEDILEELVGEIYDEHDEEEILVRKISDTEFQILGEMEIKDVFELFELKQPEEDFDFITTSAWVIHQLDRIPEVGDHFRYENIEVTVTDCDDKVVNEVKVIIDQKQDEE